MLRTALQPRWLALLALVLLVCVVFGWLGSWQLGVARDRGAQQAARTVRAQPAVPVDLVLRPQQGFTPAADSRQVSATGSYDASRHVLVSDRMQRGRAGWWVVTALRTDGGAWLPVVRGWVADPGEVSALGSSVPSGPVSLTGVLQPDDPPAGAGGTELVPGQLSELDAAELVNRWGAPIYNGYLVLRAEQLRSEQPAAGVQQPERVPPPSLAPQGIAWRNAAYALQWWVFAGFALVLWWKMVRQDQLDRARGRAVVDERVVVE